MTEEMRTGVVIPSIESRQENLRAVLDSLHQQTVAPVMTVVVCDGWSPGIDHWNYGPNVVFVSIAKHEPGREAPRNVGARFLADNSNANHVWFVDGDVIVEPVCLEKIHEAWGLIKAYDRILLCPYEWLPPGRRELAPDLYNDMRWDMFGRFTPMSVFVGHMGVALGCFSGNLVWPLHEFIRCGGFWNELHAGRCDDGELGIRAASMAVPMSLVPEARGYHLYHDIDITRVHQTNSIDVPKINAKHPWIQDEGLIVADRDGKRFNQICQGCGNAINTLEYWHHVTECPTAKPY